jgi:hypothetical protein
MKVNVFSLQRSPPIYNLYRANDKLCNMVVMLQIQIPIVIKRLHLCPLLIPMLIHYIVVGKMTKKQFPIQKRHC